VLENIVPLDLHNKLALMACLFAQGFFWYGFLAPNSKHICSTQVFTRDLHGDGDGGNPTESAGNCCWNIAGMELFAAGNCVLYLRRIIIGSDRRPETKQGIDGKIVRFRSGRIRVKDKDRRSEPDR